MAELKTKPSDQSVDEFLQTVADERKRRDSYAILDLMRRVTGEQPRMWGDAIVGFGSEHLKYESGRELDWFVAGFSPRKQNLTLYLRSGFERYQELLNRLGKFKSGKGCLYVNKLDDVDVGVLEELVMRSVQEKGGA